MLIFAVIFALLISCSSFERDNPFDCKAVNVDCTEIAIPLSSSEQSSNSEETLPSSSSSATQSSSSSSIALSSSSITPSSSSTLSCKAANNTSTEYCSNGTMKTYGYVTDDGGNTYKTVEIGTQTWMAENLNYDVAGSRCYGNDPANCDKYGRLYDWATAKTVCPEDWHLPKMSEWTTLTRYVDDNGHISCGFGSCAGKHLQATSGWYINYGQDTYGFSALPGGSSIPSNFAIGEYGQWWSSSEDGSYNAYSLAMNYAIAATGQSSLSKGYLFSVRCVRD